ncbi:MAG TPA: hypothetical protein VGS21_09735, partial [Acidimicrobiales bacterium]|nr:hypothetical protein [Acidimicrobiales bacterium]
LDRSHTSVADSLSGRRVDGKLEVEIRAHGDAELEEWAVRRKQGLFEETFGVELTLRVESTRRSRWEPAKDEGAGLA